MQWTDRIRQIKIILVAAAVVIAVASLLISHFLVQDLSKEERHRMEVWAQALHALNEADETTDLSLVLSVMEGNNTIPVIVVNHEGGVDDYRNIEDSLNVERYARSMIQAGDTIRGRTYSPFLPLIAVALIYLTLVMFLTWVVSRVERRLRSSDH